jgi:hypothetical protein
MGAATVSIKTLNIKVLFAKLGMNNGAKTINIVKLSITTFRKLTLSTIGLFATFIIIDTKLVGH